MDWIPFSFIDLIDILIVGFLFYYIYDILRKSGSGTLFLGIISLLILWALTKVFGMTLMGNLMDNVMRVGVIVLVILFQDEIKRFLNMLGSTSRWRLLKIFRFDNEKQEDIDAGYNAMLSFACSNMARKKIGALIVIEEEISLDAIIHTGEIIQANLNSRLIENIFFKNSPLHDGAMVIRNHKIVAAGCILPVSQGGELPKEMGLRHRAALGISRQSDAKVIIVSEERGKISLAHRGEMIANADSDQLQQFLSYSFRALDEVGALVSN